MSVYETHAAAQNSTNLELTGVWDDVGIALEFLAEPTLDIFLGGSTAATPFAVRISEADRFEGIVGARTDDEGAGFGFSFCG